MKIPIWALLALPYALAVTLKGSLEFDVNLPNISSVDPSSQILLNYGERRGLITQDGGFEIANVPDGEYILTGSIPGISIAPLFITIQTSPSENIHIQQFHPARLPLPTSSTSMPCPLILRALGKEDYYTPPPGMNIFGLFKNPMVLMMLFSGVMMWGIPKLSAQLETDPEMARELAETRKKMQGYQNMDWAGSLSSMLAGGEEEKATAAKPSVNQGGGGPGMKKRKGK